MTLRALVTVAIAALLAQGLIGCGGGGGDGPVTSQFGAHERSNPGAQDLLAHWNDPDRLRSALASWRCRTSTPDRLRSGLCWLV